MNFKWCHLERANSPKRNSQCWSKFTNSSWWTCRSVIPTPLTKVDFNLRKMISCQSLQILNDRCNFPYSKVCLIACHTHGRALSPFWRASFAAWNRNACPRGYKAWDASGAPCLCSLQFPRRSESCSQGNCYQQIDFSPRPGHGCSEWQASWGPGSQEWNRRQSRRVGWQSWWQGSGQRGGVTSSWDAASPPRTAVWVEKEDPHPWGGFFRVVVAVAKAGGTLFNPVDCSHRPLEWLSATPPEFALRTERGTPVVPAPWPKKPNRAACVHLTATASSHCEVKSSQSCPTPWDPMQYTAHGIL